MHALLLLSFAHSKYVIRAKKMVRMTLSTLIRMGGVVCHLNDNTEVAYICSKFDDFLHVQYFYDVASRRHIKDRHDETVSRLSTLEVKKLNLKSRLPSGIRKL